MTIINKKNCSFCQKVHFLIGEEFMENGCWNCAYAQKKDGKPVWCNFHEVEVDDNKTCDDFLDYLDSPVMSALLADYKNKKSGGTSADVLPVSNRIKDIFGWICIVFFIILGIFAFLYC